MTPPERYVTQDFDGFLRDTMHTVNALRPVELDKLELRFRLAMDGCKDLFGEHAFRKQFRGVTRRYPIDKALFEVQAVAVAGCRAAELDVLRDRAPLLESRFKELMDDPAFYDAISSGTGDADKVNYRFQSMKDLFREVLHA
ncbi:hypothetical protein JL475_20660 [Streptomyces sp. M2CJ-2]|uniref:hypothetical protein n=1 Tax=Streptomyces sp. M2CJ-2 TaxID=2803948 RepID=UPI0019271E7D|nr:hypothetical protein [Streptomyces sp. M2CJ-2]MBL3668359.1 hypothetical protein [Streptomyces sp. M2CJ-2]